MKTLILVLLMVAICENSRADAVSYNEPRKDQVTVLLNALTSLQELKSTPLSSHFSEPDTAYYLRDASFMGRTQTARGFKNLIRVTFVRSSLYSEVRSATPPPRGHSLVIIFSDELVPEHYLPIPMPDSASLEGAVLIVDGGKYPLSSEATLNAFSNIESEGGAGKPATRSKSDSEGDDKPQ